MTKRTSTRLALFRYFLVYVLTLGVATTLLVNPSQLWAWALAAVLGVGFGIHVHRTSQRWLEAMNADLEELGDRPIPEEAEGEVRRLLEAGFDGPQWWVHRGQIGATLLSPDGSISAVVAAGDEHTGPILRTKWEDAELQTSRGLAIPVLPNGYVQNLADVDLPALLTAHDEAAEALSRVYGEPIQRDELTLGSLNDARRRRRMSFRSAATDRSPKSWPSGTWGHITIALSNSSDLQHLPGLHGYSPWLRGSSLSEFGCTFSPTAHQRTCRSFSPRRSC